MNIIDLRNALQEIEDMHKKLGELIEDLSSTIDGIAEISEMGIDPLDGEVDELVDLLDSAAELLRAPAQSEQSALWKCEDCGWANLDNWYECGYCHKPRFERSDGG